MKEIYFFVFLSLLVVVFGTPTEGEERKIPIDTLLSVPNIILKNGYPVEEHTVQTEDGYILQMHRIPFGIAPNAGPGEKKIPIFLQHGLMASSADYILAGPNRSLGYILADLGYDVWMGNARGTKYSRKHVILNPAKSKFWEFSWHEIGIYDNPAMIDYILEETKEEQLFYIGHSQGATTFYVMCSERPEYNKKIRAMVGLGPAGYLGHLKSPFLRYLANYAGQINILLKIIGIHEFLPQTSFLKIFGGALCAKDNPLHFICTNAYFIISGFNPGQMDMDLLPIIVGHTPAGSSTRQHLHYAQLVKSVDKFRKFDFGLVQNLLKYRSMSPPSYNISKITAPVAIWYAHNDLLIDERDVMKLYNELSNPIGLFLVPDKIFNHVDYLYAKNVVDVCYNDVTSFLSKH